jgi:hypothetical protein
MVSILGVACAAMPPALMPVAVMMYMPAEMDADLVVRTANWTKEEKLVTAASLRRIADQLERSAALMVDDLYSLGIAPPKSPGSGRVWN